MADKGGLQLLPETRKKIEVRIPGENRLIYAGGAIVVLVLALYGGLWFYASSLQGRLDASKNQLDALEKQRNATAEQNLLVLSKQMAVTSQILQNHIYWSTGFSKIETAIQPAVQFESFSGLLGNGTFGIRAIADNYSTIARQLASLVADDAITDVTLDSVNVLTSGKLDFTAKIIFDKSKFLKSNQ